MASKFTSKERRRIVLTSILCIFIIGVSVISSIDNIFKIREKNKEKKDERA